jgi:hypothetical protein
MQPVGQQVVQRIVSCIRGLRILTAADTPFESKLLSSEADLQILVSLEFRAANHRTAQKVLDLRLSPGDSSAFNFPIGIIRHHFQSLLFNILCTFYLYHLIPQNLLRIRSMQVQVILVINHDGMVT